MNQALGLIVAAPAILLVIAFMYRQGAVSLVGAITAAIMSIIIAIVLFLS
ncbi:hypothetical protein [Terrihabitans sp. B22-R8]